MPDPIIEIGAAWGILEDVGSPPWRARRMPVSAVFQKSQLELKHPEDFVIVSPHDHTSNKVSR
jgi:hypothetical protein